MYSYNLLVITLFSIPIIFFFKIKIFKKAFIIFSTFFIIISVYIFGNYTINQNKKLLENNNKKIYVKIISPNFNLEYGLNEKEILDRFKRLIRYSEPDEKKKTLFIWPEGVFSGYSYKEILNFKNLITNNFSKDHLILFGINILDKNSGNFYNSMIVVNHQLDIIQSYNKRRLVPFGEFLPFENLLTNFGLKKITEGYGSFLKGKESKNFLINELNILPLICYEIIFTDLIQKSSGDTNLIVNISEDGWFGNTIGPDQHLAKSIFRAIENNTFL